MNSQEKAINWILVFITACFAGVTVCILLLFLNMVFEYFNFSEVIIGGVIGATGGIIGGSFTFFGVRSTLKQDKRKNLESGRTYISIISAQLSYKLSEIQLEGRKRVIETDIYKDLRKKYPESQYKDHQMVYYKLNHFGSPHFVFEVKVKIYFSDKSVILLYVGIVEKNETILIPLWLQGIPWNHDTNIISIEAAYQTEVGESIVYRTNYKDKITYEKYFSVVKGKEQIIKAHEPTESQTWIYLN